MLRSLDVLPAFTSAISYGERLKNAISDPLAKADAPMSIIVSSMARTTPVVGASKLTFEIDSIKKFMYVSTIYILER